MKGAARLSKVLGPDMMEAYAWDGAEEHLAQFRAEIEATEKLQNRLPANGSRYLVESRPLGSRLTSCSLFDLTGHTLYLGIVT